MWRKKFTEYKTIKINKDLYSGDFEKILWFQNLIEFLWIPFKNIFI